MSFTDLLEGTAGRVIIVVLAVLALGFGLAYRIEHHHTAELIALNTQLTNERDTLQVESKLTAAAVTLNNDVSQVAHDQKASVSDTANQTVVYITKRVSVDECANKPIDPLSVDRLHQYANGLHQTAVDTATR